MALKQSPVQTETLNFYNENAASFTAGTVDVQFSAIQDLFLSYLPEGADILDFGCGSGRDTKYFLDKGYRVDAVDGSRELCRIASGYTGITVRNMFFEELDAVNAYDGIWACASVLHLEKGALPDVFARMTQAVKENGIIYVSFKYGDFEGVKEGRYFTYLTEVSFGERIRTCPELSVETLWVSTDVRPGRESERWLNVILRKASRDALI